MSEQWRGQWVCFCWISTVFRQSLVKADGEHGWEEHGAGVDYLRRTKVDPRPVFWCQSPTSHCWRPSGRVPGRNYFCSLEKYTALNVDTSTPSSECWPSKIEMGENQNAARTNRTRSQILPRTELNPKVKNVVQEPEPNRTEPNPVKNRTEPADPNVVVLTRFFHWMKW